MESGNLGVKKCGKWKLGGPDTPPIGVLHEHKVTATRTQYDIFYGATELMVTANKLKFYFCPAFILILSKVC